MKAGANIGSVIGQFGFGFAADYFGRKAVCKLISLTSTERCSVQNILCVVVLVVVALDGKELMLIIFATIMCISDPTNDLSPSGALLWLAIWRIVLGVGVGGDYPMSASITSDRAHLKRRGKSSPF